MMLPPSQFESRRDGPPAASGVARGITLVEAVVSIMIVGGLLAAALSNVGISRKTQKVLSDNARGQQLAVDLMNEILTQRYMTAGNPPVFGLEAGKSGANRSQFTDVDDYDGWSETPPRDKCGNALAGVNGWVRSATVVFADPVTWLQTSTPNTGLKLITVEVSNGAVVVGTVAGYRSFAWVDVIPASIDPVGNRAPLAIVVASQTTAQSSLTTTLDATGSSDPDGDSITYSWSFGDGETGTGGKPSHTYTSVGMYTATVTVSDGKGGVQSASVVLSVTP